MVKKIKRDAMAKYSNFSCVNKTFWCHDVTDSYEHSLTCLGTRTKYVDTGDTVVDTADYILRLHDERFQRFGLSLVIL